MNPQRFARLCQVLNRRQPDLTVLMDGVHKPRNFALSISRVWLRDPHEVIPLANKAAFGELVFGAAALI